LAQNVRDITGPVQTMNVITDKDSTYTNISAEALYFVYGWGPNEAGVAPWTVDAHAFARQATSFAHLFFAASINVPYETAYGVGTAQERDTQAKVISAIDLAGQTDADSTIGYVSGSAADNASDKVKILAYQGYGQECAYWPDSKQNSLDRINVRTGLYDLWTPGHFFAETDEDGIVVNEHVRNLISSINGLEEGPAGIDVTRIVIESGDIPHCAMKVQREGMRGAIASYAPGKPCECYFETIATKKVPAYCDACADDSECSDPDRPACNYGYCEAYRRD
jgi:hypothetical protein